MNALGIAIAAGIGLLLVSLFFDRVWTPWQARRGIEKLLRSKRPDPRALEKPEYGSIASDADGLRMRSGNGHSSELRWSDVEEVHAFKRDLWATDLICLEFKRSGRDEYYEIHEEMAGYHDLLQVLPFRLSGFSMEWFPAVAFPAFATNHQMIWKRAPSPPRAASALPSA